MIATADAKQVAATILEQLGGNKFRAMTGAHSFMSDTNGNGSLTFKYPHRKGFSHSAVKITLNGSDLYDMEFIDMNRKMEFTRKTIENVYDDQLQSVFTSETGLVTRL